MMVDNLCAIKTVICSFSWETSLMVEVISSSVMLSNAEVASSKISKCGFLSNALAMAILCFSPPLYFNPPSPITVFMPFSARSIKVVALDFFKANCKSSSVASGFTKRRFSFIVPANNCVSCVTKPI